jgi:hypothetical protein
MKVIFTILFTSITILFSTELNAQDLRGIQPEKGRYALDSTHQLAVWSPGINTRNYLWRKTRDSILVNNSVYAMSSNSKWLCNRKDSIKLVKTRLPFIQIHTAQPIVDEPKTLVRIQYTHNDTVLDLTAGIELRGNSALLYPKKSYDLEFRDSKNTQESIDVQLENMREDDDWILNSIYNEPLRLRSRFSNGLWLDMQSATKKRKGQAGVRMRYAEVFLDDKYQGIYLISEQVDRKLLDLKKKKGDSVRGELFKASSYQPGCMFTDAPAFNNAFPTWAGFEMKYPYEDYTAHYDDLAAFVGMVSKGSDEEFNNSVSNWLDFENAIDYFLFVNLLRATDNLGKNYYLARMDEGKPYFFIPWDLDGVLGTIQDGKRIPTTNDILSNGLFDRLWENNPSNYRDRVINRWKELRTGEFSNDHLFSKLERLYVALSDAGVYEREQLIWNKTLNPSQDYEYLTTWLRDRLEYLDGYFSDK